MWELADWQGLFSKPVLGFGKVFVINKVPVLIEANSKSNAPTLLN